MTKNELIKAINTPGQVVFVSTQLTSGEMVEIRVVKKDLAFDVSRAVEGTYEGVFEVGFLMII